MAVTRMSLGKIMAQPPKMDRAKMAATTEADLRRHAREDGEDPDAPLHAEDWQMAAETANGEGDNTGNAEQMHVAREAKRRRRAVQAKLAK